jgi:hypothetical protein
MLLLGAAGSADAAKKKPHTRAKATKTYAGCIAYLERKGHTIAGSSAWCSAHNNGN